MSAAWDAMAEVGQSGKERLASRRPPQFHTTLPHTNSLVSTHTYSQQAERPQYASAPSKPRLAQRAVPTLDWTRQPQESRFATFTLLLGRAATMLAAIKAAKAKGMLEETLIEEEGGE